jgi:hypothetical protein
MEKIGGWRRGWPLVVAAGLFAGVIGWTSPGWAGLAQTPALVDEVDEVDECVAPVPLPTATELARADHAGAASLSSMDTLVASGSPAPDEPKETTTTYTMTVPENIKPLKTITCGDVEVQWLKIDDLERPDVYQIVPPKPIDADKCKVKLELLDKDGKVKETFETNSPMKANDRLWIGRVYGHLYFEQGRPGTYKITVTCKE